MSEIVVRDAIAQSYLAEGLTAAQVDQLASFSKLETYADGDDILRQDEGDRDILVLIEGQAGIYSYTVSALPSERIGEVQPGVLFGEVALFDEGRRSAIVRSEGPVTAVRIDGLRLLEAMEEDAALGNTVKGNVIKVLCQRLRNTTRQLAMYIALDTF